MTKEEKARELKWQTESDLGTLQRAIEITNDKKRLEATKKLAQEREAQLEHIQKLDENFLDVCGMNK